jgi:hypothetical protein
VPFSSLPSDNHLTTVTIMIDLGFGFKSSLKSCAVLDGILTPAHYKYLKSFKLEVICWAYEGSPSPEAAHIREVMPLTDARGILRIDLTVNWAIDDSDDECWHMGLFD